MADPTLADIADKVDDVARLVARQSAALGALADTRATAAGPDLALLVELHALRVDALACAGTAASRRDGEAFTAIAARLERLVAGRGGSVVAPAAGAPFDAATMEAAEVVTTADPARDRTVARLLEPGLAAAGRSVRPARVAVHRLARPA